MRFDTREVACVQSLGWVRDHNPMHTAACLLVSRHLPKIMRTGLAQLSNSVSWTIQVLSRLRHNSCFSEKQIIFLTFFLSPNLLFKTQKQILQWWLSIQHRANNNHCYSTDCVKMSKPSKPTGKESSLKTILLIKSTEKSVVVFFSLHNLIRIPCQDQWNLRVRISTPFLKKKRTPPPKKKNNNKKTKKQPTVILHNTFCAFYDRLYYPLTLTLHWLNFK